MLKKKIAIFPAGTEIGLEIQRSLSYSTHFEVFGFSSIPDHARYVFKNYDESLPYYNSESFLFKLNKLLDKYEIDYLYPAHDDVQLYLTENESRINAKIITSDLNSVRICRSKLSTYKLFNQERFVPEVFSESHIPQEYPVFAKPNIGQGSKGVRLIKSKIEFEEALNCEKKDGNCGVFTG